MTSKKAIEILTTNKPTSDTRKCGEELCEAIDLAIEALENQEKYKWHDLRKNPKDLPKLITGYEWFECVHEEHENDSFYANYQYAEEYGFGEWHDIFDNGTYGFIGSEFKSVEDMGYTPIVGWREIELFEREEKNDT